MATSTYPLPRDEQGRIITSPLLPTDDLVDPVEAPPTPILQTAPVGSPPPAAPARRPGELPTPFGQQPGKAAAPQRLTPRQIAAAAGVAVLLVALGWAALRTAPPAPAPAPTAAPTAAAPPTATPLPLLARAVVAFDAPDGTPVGALDPGRAYRLVEERGIWRQLDVAGSGTVWVRSWEMDGLPPIEPTPLPTAVPTLAPPPAPAAPAAPAATCVPVLDGDNNNAYLGEACGATSEERRQRALELLQAAPPPARP